MFNLFYSNKPDAPTFLFVDWCMKLDLGAGAGGAGIRANGTGAGIATGATGAGGSGSGVAEVFHTFDIYHVPSPRTPTAQVRKTSVLNELCEESSVTALVTTVFFSVLFSDSELVFIIDAISEICFFMSDNVSSR